MLLNTMYKSFAKAFQHHFRPLLVEAFYIVIKLSSSLLGTS